MNDDSWLIKSVVGQFSARLLRHADLVWTWEVFDADGEIIETINTLDPLGPLELMFYEKGWNRAYEKGKADGRAEHHAEVINAINSI